MILLNHIDDSLIINLNILFKQQGALVLVLKTQKHKASVFGIVCKFF